MHWKTQLTSLKYSGGCQIESVKQATVSTECRNPVELFSCLLVMDHWLWATLTRQECNGNLWNGWKCNAFGENNRAKLFKTRGNECFIMCPCYSMHYQLIRSSSDLHYESPWLSPDPPIPPLNSVDSHKGLEDLLIRSALEPHCIWTNQDCGISISIDVKSKIVEKGGKHVKCGSCFRQQWLVIWTHLSTLIL